MDPEQFKDYIYFIIKAALVYILINNKKVLTIVEMKLIF